MAYLRARRSVKLGAGVRLNLNKDSVGVSFGGPGARLSVNSKGRRTTTIGVPGSGLSYVSQSNAKRHPAHEPAPATPEPKPGLFASHTEKAFAKAIHAYLKGNPAATGFHEALDADAKQSTSGPIFFCAISALDKGDLPLAASCLEQVVLGDHPVPDELMRKYAPGFALTGTVTRPSRSRSPQTASARRCCSPTSTTNKTETTKRLGCSNSSANTTTAPTSSCASPASTRRSRTGTRSFTSPLASATRTTSPSWPASSKPKR